MNRFKTRTDLPPHVAVALKELYVQMSLPVCITRLTQEILTRDEIRLVEEASPSVIKRLSETVRAVLSIVAQQRRISLERALLDLSRSLDMFGEGRYESLRLAIGEPVASGDNEVPRWKLEEGRLYCKGRLIRTVSGQGTDLRSILNAFEEDHWPPRIDSPLSGTPLKRRRAIASLNKGLSGIVFKSDGTSEGILWHEVAELRRGTGM